MKQLFIILSILIFGASCTNNNKYEINTTEKYESNKKLMAQAEQKNPAQFLTVHGITKKNLLGQTVLKCRLINNARMVTYKDVNIELSFYSKTGSLLEKNNETVYETVHPGGSTSFKSKYFAPKGTDSVAMQIVSAKY